MTLNTLFNRARNKNTPAATVDVSKMRVPQHVAIIMDGNGRWAKGRGLPRLAGHHAGTENLHKIVRAAAEHDIKVLTLWAFSTENWSRPQEEVSGLMKILEEVIEKEIDELASNGVQLRHIGRLDRLPPYLQEGIQAAIERTAKNERIILNIALDYGGRAEIVDAVKALMRAGVSPDDVNEQLIEPLR
jgi:undecaprenyl diphosphate synthase